MLRTLPPAGHPLRINEIVGAFKADAVQKNFISKFFEDIPCLFVSSGSAALTLSLLGLKSCSERTEVILPAYTCPSLLASVVKAGLEPVLCDLNPYEFRLDLKSLASKIGPKTLAIIAVHLYGIPENIIDIKKLVEDEGIFLIEDAAQAFGNRIDNGSIKFCGRYGDLSVLSFGRGKPLSLLNGGAVLINNPELCECTFNAYQNLKESNSFQFQLEYILMLFLYSILFQPRMYWLPKMLPWLNLGETFFTVDFSVRKIGPKVLNLGGCVFENFDRIRKIRLDLTKRYKVKTKEFGNSFEYLPDFEGDNIALLRFPIIFKESQARDRALKSLEASGLGASCSYPLPINELRGTEPYIKGRETFHNAKKISERVMTLPLHEYVSLQDVDKIIQIIGESI